MNTLLNTYMFRYPKIFGLIVLVVSFCIGCFTVSSLKEQYRLKSRTELDFRAGVFKDKFEEIIRGSHVAAKSIAFLVEKDLLGDQFEEVAERILARTPGLYGLQLLRKSVIEYTYPIKDNEVILGYDLAKRKNHVLSLDITEEREDMYFEGPFILKQGFSGIVGRNPIFVGDSLWGFSAVIIKSDELIKHLGLDESGNYDGFMYQIVNSRENQVVESLFETQPHDSYDNDLVISTKLGDWLLTVTATLDYTWFYIGYGLVSVIALLFGLLSWYLTALPAILQSKIRKRTIDLVSATTKLQESSGVLKRKDEEIERFSFVTSHHLKEPLRIIEIHISRYKRILNKKKEYLTPDELLVLNVITEQTHRLKLIIGDLSRLLSIPNVPNKLLNAGLKVIVSNILNDLLPDSEEVVCEAEVEDVPVPKEILELIVYELVSNSLKFKKSNEPLRLFISGKITGKNYVLSVQDNGRGIQADYLEIIFNLFSRLNQQENTGTGIGLAIVLKCVESIKGKVKCMSSLNVGSTFEITFPMQSFS
jgi:signal transduction histidine kinase